MKKILSNYIIGFIIGFYVGSIAIRAVLNADNTAYNNIINDNAIYEQPILPNLDTIYITRDSIINNIKYITKTQYDTIEKVYSISDTASVELFYKLVSEWYSFYGGA